MKKVGFIFSTPPHGTASGREGLDAVLATSAFSDNLALYFIGDGVMQLLTNQQPGKVLCRDYISTFKMLELCEVEDVYVCQTSLDERGLSDIELVIDCERLCHEDIGKAFSLCDRLIHF